MKYFLLILTLVFTSCSLTNNIEIAEGNSVNIDFKSNEYFSSVLSDIASFTNDIDTENSILNIYYNIYSAKNTSSSSIVKTGVSAYFINFTTPSLNILFDEITNSNQTIIKQTDNETTFKLNINNYSELEKIIPELKDPNLEVYLAPYNIGYTQEDYLNLLAFSFTDEIKDEVINSNIIINGKTDKPIKSITGGEKLSSNTFSITIPLIKFLLLDEEIYFKLTY